MSAALAFAGTLVLLRCYEDAEDLPASFLKRRLGLAPEQERRDVLRKLKETSNIWLRGNFIKHTTSIEGVVWHSNEWGRGEEVRDAAEKDAKRRVRYRFCVSVCLCHSSYTSHLSALCRTAPTGEA